MKQACKDTIIDDSTGMYLSGYFVLWLNRMAQHDNVRFQLTGDLLANPIVFAGAGVCARLEPAASCMQRVAESADHGKFLNA